MREMSRHVSREKEKAPFSRNCKRTKFLLLFRFSTYFILICTLCHIRRINVNSIILLPVHTSLVPQTAFRDTSRRVRLFGEDSYGACL